MSSELTADKRAVALIAATLAKHAPRRRFRRQPSPFDFVLIAREITVQ